MLTMLEVKKRFKKAFGFSENDEFSYNSYLSYLHEVYYYYDNFHYFTFGSDEAFPFQNGYIIIEAANEATAKAIFKENFPNRPNSDCLNYSFNYSSSEWEKMDTTRMGKFYGIYG